MSKGAGMKLADEQYIAAIEGWPIMAQWGRKSVEALAEVLAHRQPAQPEAQPTVDCHHEIDTPLGKCQTNVRAAINATQSEAQSAKSDEAYWRKCPQCKRENSVQSWEKNNGKCPNCDDIFDKEDREASEFAAMANEGGFEAQPAPDGVEQQVTAILQETVKETNEKWEAAAEKVARVREGK